MGDEENLEAQASSSPVSASASAASLPEGGHPVPRRPGLERSDTSDTIRTIGWLKLRGENDDLPQRWWFASTAIPLLAATICPLANVLSIAALVTPWRLALPNHGELPEGADDNGAGIADPHWEVVLNAVSLAAGFTGNMFLLLNFTGRIRYIIALPMSILFWTLAAWIFIVVIICIHRYLPVASPGEIYSQGFWHAVMAAILYCLGSIMLMVNMLGYFKGHYPQDFDLTDDQRTLILQTMMFFFWLAGGAGIFCRIEGLTFVNSLYFADISILTIGFGDIYPHTDAGRGFLFVFQLIGIIFLGLVIGSISRFASNISADKIVRTHQRQARELTFDRTVTNEHELRERLGLPPSRRASSYPHHHGASSSARGGARGGGGGAAGDATSASASASASSPLSSRRRESLNRYGRLEIVGRSVTFHHNKAMPAQRSAIARGSGGGGGGGGSDRRRQKLLLLREEKDRFEAMREIQDETRRFKQYWALGMAFLAFGVLWCFGALIFMLTEKRLLELTYFQAMYFCFISLLTIGYGDFSPRSNIGKPFFIVWSLVAVPTVTILIQQMSKTVAQAVNRGTFRIADWTVLPKKGVVASFLDNHPRLRDGLARASAGYRRRVRSLWGGGGSAAAAATTDEEQAVPAAAGTAPASPASATVPAAESPPSPSSGGDRGDDGRVKKMATMESLVAAAVTPDVGVGGPSTTTSSANGFSNGSAGGADDVDATHHQKQHDLARQLAVAIKSVAHDLRARPPKRYSYSEWVLFTKLIRFSSRRSKEEVERLEEEEGMVEWDWIGEDSPMLADETEPEWVLDRLCESLIRYTRRQAGRNATRRRYLAKNLESKLPETIPEAETDDTCSGAVQPPTTPLCFEDPESKEWAERMKTGGVSDGADTRSPDDGKRETTTGQVS